MRCQDSRQWESNRQTDRQTDRLALKLVSRVMSKFANQRLSSAFDLLLIFLCSLIQTLTLTPSPNNALWQTWTARYEAMDRLEAIIIYYLVSVPIDYSGQTLLCRLGFLYAVLSNWHVNQQCWRFSECKKLEKTRLIPSACTLLRVCSLAWVWARWSLHSSYWKALVDSQCTLAFLQSVQNCWAAEFR